MEASPSLPVPTFFLSFEHLPAQSFFPQFL
jgi:hypothetical protein